MKQLDIFEQLRFNGSDYVKAFDQERLTGQLKRVYSIMIDGKFRTLQELQREILSRYGKRDPESSISAQLRHLRKERFGSHLLEKQPRGDRKNGLFEYKLIKE